MNSVFPKHLVSSVPTILATVNNIPQFLGILMVVFFRRPDIRMPHQIFCIKDISSGLNNLRTEGMPRRLVIRTIK